MPRLAAILSALLLLASPALAVPVTFEPDEDLSSVSFGCTASLQNGTCNLDDVDVEVDDDEPVAVGQSFRFLKFEAKGTEKIGDGFFVIATLVFRVTGLPTPYTATATGIGTFTAKGDRFRSFSIDWTPIARFVTTSVGTFSVAFENLEMTKKEKEEGEKKLYVNARISAVPLPAGAWLLLSGLALIGAARLRRRALSA